MCLQDIDHNNFIYIFLNWTLIYKYLQVYSGILLTKGLFVYSTGIPLPIQWCLLTVRD